MEVSVLNEVDRTRRWWNALRLALVLLWLLAAVTAWWTAPRHQSYETARADSAAGHVVAYQWGDHWGADDPGHWFGAPVLQQGSGQPGPLFAWKTSDGRVHWTDTTTFDQVAVTDAVAVESYSGVGAVGIAQNLRDAGIDHRAILASQRTPVVTGIVVLLAAIALGVVIVGPTPHLGTRWFWFWLFFFTPHGLGLLYWLAREHPWARPTADPAAPGGGERRDRGALGFAIGIIVAIVYSAVLLILHRTLGDWWVPSPGA